MRSKNVLLILLFNLEILTETAEQFSKWDGGGVTGEFKWGAEGTLLLVSLQFFGKSGVGGGHGGGGGEAKAPPSLSK